MIRKIILVILPTWFFFSIGYVILGEVLPNYRQSAKETFLAPDVSKDLAKFLETTF